MGTPLFLFDFDKTLYAYDFRKRLPRLAELTGVSQYTLAKTWWEGGHEAAAESGEYLSTDEYLAAFNDVTGASLTADGWREARRAAMTPIPASFAALRRAGELGTVSLLSNNPIIFRDSLHDLAPEVAGVLGENDLVSAVLGARKPEARIYTRALSRFGIPAVDAMLVDDSGANVRGAEAVGITGFQLLEIGGGYNTDALVEAIEAFAAERGVA
ncbi:HAD-IA family hydrolase [Agromyces sp. Soil535]|uniref:HAD-IA family hydrolase n=1 Tax=Agromyces sp. Soil535 TaxID=1736390 RepID=UPI000700EA93|nr:HAD-IA family hydrolase [Agromyces sp. Soil535]KRE26133.1 hydrolase [Agromyces sp. Soil535]